MFYEKQQRGRETEKRPEQFVNELKDKKKIRIRPGKNFYGFEINFCVSVSDQSQLLGGNQSADSAFDV